MGAQTDSSSATQQGSGDALSSGLSGNVDYLDPKSLHVHKHLALKLHMTRVSVPLLSAVTECKSSRCTRLIPAQVLCAL